MNVNVSLLTLETTVLSTRTCFKLLDFFLNPLDVVDILYRLCEFQVAVFPFHSSDYLPASVFCDRD